MAATLPLALLDQWSSVDGGGHGRTGMLEVPGQDATKAGDVIQSFGTTAEIVRLGELAHDRVVLELGSFRGASAVVMAKAGARMVHAVDWHQGDEHVGGQDTLCEMWHHLGRLDVRDRVVLHVGRFQDVLPLFRPESFDLVFVDGCHHATAVARDLKLALPLLRSGGKVACHDYGHWDVAGIVDEAHRRQGVGKLEVTDTLAVWGVA